MLHKELFLPNETALKQHPVLVALSGGPDSVALLCALIAAGYDCRAAHCNFHLRGDESMRDEHFVRELCKRLGVPLVVKDFDVSGWQQEHGGSVEMACRELRYEWFEQERQRQDCDVVAVAHHANDQVETFFLNLMRGTGTKGLAGMSRLNGNIWRPLLNVTRQELLDYLQNMGQEYVTDSTNNSNEFRRNRLRNDVLPVIEQQFPNAGDHIIETMDNLRDDYEVMMSLVHDKLPNERHINAKDLLSIPCASTLLYHRIRHMGFNRGQCDDAVHAVQQGLSGKIFYGKGNEMLVVNRQTLDIEPITLIEDIIYHVNLENGIEYPVHITISHDNPPFAPAMCDGRIRVAFNSNILNCQHVVLRHWKKGDRFRPFGMKGSKLLSDLFADLKVDYSPKHQLWLLEADGDILWVLGYRASALYPVVSESKDYLLMTLNEH